MTCVCAKILCSMINTPFPVHVEVWGGARPASRPGGGRAGGLALDSPEAMAARARAATTRSLARPCLGELPGTRATSWRRVVPSGSPGLRLLASPGPRLAPDSAMATFFSRLSLLLQILFTNLAHSLPLTERHSASRSVSCTCLLGCLLTTHLLLKAGSLCTLGRALTDSSATLCCCLLFLFVEWKL